MQRGWNEMSAVYNQYLFSSYGRIWLNLRELVEYTVLFGIFFAFFCIYYIIRL